MSRNFIHFDPDSEVPKYRQIMQSVKLAIEKKSLKKGDKLPSINQISSLYNLSRDTVMYAYNELKSHGIICSNKGKGYYVESTEIEVEEKIFLLFDEFNSTKEELYNAFINAMNSSASVDVFFHRFNYQVFKNQINNNIGKYTAYVVMPASFENLGHLIQKLPENRVFLLDRLKPELKGYPVVYQDFEADVYEGLVKVRNLLSKYRRLVFVQSSSKEPQERLIGFKKFCQEFSWDYTVVKSLSEIRPALYDVFLVPSDRTLVELIKLATDYDYEIGMKFGIISFNDSLFKQILAGGITTISTDFVQMGQNLAGLVLSHSIRQLRNSSGIVIRKSL